MFGMDTTVKTTHIHEIMISKTRFGYSTIYQTDHRREMKYAPSITGLKSSNHTHPDGSSTIETFRVDRN
jgi:hypothetical protein